MRALASGFVFSLGLAACGATPSAPAATHTVSIAPPPDTATAVPLVTHARPVRIELFMMAHDPYVRRLLPDLESVVKRFGPDADMVVDFIGTDDAERGLSSMRGPEEVADDLVKVCAKKHAKDWLAFFACDTDEEIVPGRYKECARAVGIDLAPIEACASGDEGRALLSQSFARSRDAAAQGSPTVVIGQNRYTGDRRRRSILRRVCEAHEDPKPTLCGEIGEAPPVAIRVLTDARCQECNAASAQSKIRGGIDNPAFTQVDYSSPEGRALYQAIGRAPLPVAVFDESLDKDPEVSAWLTRQLKKAGGQRIYSAGDWLPHCADQGGCGFEECKASPACAVEIPKRVELFIMSKCPFGAKAIRAMPEVLKAFQKKGEKLELQVSYIGEGTAVKGFTSMHGPAEVEEDIRAVCAIKHYAKNAKFLDYLTCRAADQKSDDWKACTGKNGIAPKVIEDCWKGTEGPALLEASFARTRALRIKASPTFVINDKFRAKGLTVEAITAGVCEHNAALRTCKAPKTPTSPAKPSLAPGHPPSVTP